MSRVRSSAICLALLGSCQGLLAAELLYSTGEPTPITDIATQALTNGGYISGFFDSTLPQRYTATSFTLEHDVTLEEAVVYWFDNEDNTTLPPTNKIAWNFYADDVGGGPGTQLFTGIIDQSLVVNEEWIEPVGLVATDWKRRFPISGKLSAGTYWVSFHGTNGAVGWLTGALEGSDVMYRATVGTDYTFYTNTIWETPDDPGRLYHVAFELHGTVDSEPPPCEGDANADGVVDPLDSGYVLSRFGCPVGTGDPTCDASDQNLDGIVDPLDAGFVLSRFGPCPTAITGDTNKVEVTPSAARPLNAAGNESNFVPAVD